MQRKDKGVQDLTPAPGELRLVQAFINTADLDAGTDELASSRALADWLARHGLLPAATEPNEADRQRAVEVREGWRSMVAGSSSEELAEALDRATVAAALRARHGADGSIRLEPSAAGLDGALGRLLAIVLRAQIDGSWRRLKVCNRGDCRAVFYDRSDNLSRRWCRPRCGNSATSKISKRRARQVERRGREARRRARALAEDPYEPSLSELEKDPRVGDLARWAREAEERR